MGIGTVLLDRELITRQQLDDAIQEQARSGERLDRVLMRMGVVDRPQILRAVGEQLRLDVVDLADVVVSQDVLESLPAAGVASPPCRTFEKPSIARFDDAVAACDDGSVPEAASRCYILLQ